MATIVLIRAGSTDYDEQHRLLGTLDLPVNQRGAEEIREIVRQLQQKNVRLEAIYTSPENPACETAYALSESQPSAKIREVDELRNVNQGLWQGLPESDIRRRFPKLFRNSRDGSISICPPEGETLLDACQRLARVLTKAIRKHQVFAVVASEPLATVIRCTLQHRQPRVSACLCGEEQTELVQIIESNIFDTAHFLAGEVVVPPSSAAPAAGSANDAVVNVSSETQEPASVNGSLSNNGNHSRTLPEGPTKVTSDRQESAG